MENHSNVLVWMRNKIFIFFYHNQVLLPQNVDASKRWRRGDSARPGAVIKFTPHPHTLSIFIFQNVVNAF